MKTYYVYILASGKNGTLYIGVTNDLLRRVSEHKKGEPDKDGKESFTKKYRIDKLVHFEDTDDVGAAIQREKQLKNWKRSWQIALIEKTNSSWEDLFGKLF